MPGVPSGRGCDACRKQKKKCDQFKPSCSRCSRLQIPCVGAGQQRFKFLEQNPSDVSDNSKQMVKASKSASPSERTYVLPVIPKNDLNRLVDTYFAAIRPSTDVRYNLAWSFGNYLDELPQRLGHNEALDAAALALCEAYSVHCLASRTTVSALTKYSEALRMVRIYLDDPVKARAAETLCAVNLLLLCQSFLGLVEGSFTGHCEGMAQIIKVRGGYNKNNAFETRLLHSLRGCVIFEGMLNKNIRLTPQEWKSLTYNPLDGESFGGQLMRCLCLVPCFTTHRFVLEDATAEEIEMLDEIREGYQQLKTLLPDMTTRLHDLASAPDSGLVSKQDAIFLRTYGIVLVIAIILNCVLGAITIDAADFMAEAIGYAKEILLIAQCSIKYRPLSAMPVVLCLSYAWVAATESSLRLLIEQTLYAWSDHSSWGLMYKISRSDLEISERILRLLGRP